MLFLYLVCRVIRLHTHWDVLVIVTMEHSDTYLNLIIFGFKKILNIMALKIWMDFPLSSFSILYSVS